VDDKIYWFDPSENVISRQSMDGKRKEVFHSLPPGRTPVLECTVVVKHTTDVLLQRFPAAVKIQ